jgi:hypothetical protein
MRDHPGSLGVVTLNWELVEELLGPPGSAHPLCSLGVLRFHGFWPVRLDTHQFLFRIAARVSRPPNL